MKFGTSIIPSPRPKHFSCNIKSVTIRLLRRPVFCNVKQNLIKQVQIAAPPLFLLISGKSRIGSHGNTPKIIA